MTYITSKQGLRLLSLAAVALAATSGCNIGPKYTRPAAPVPPAFRGAAFRPPPGGRAALHSHKPDPAAGAANPAERKRDPFAAG